MPIYTYKCRQCKKTYEYFHVRSDDQASCPHCGSTANKKLISETGGHVLKGKGWARDGYK